MARVAGLAQAADDRVGVNIDSHARKEEQTADPDVGLCEPVVVIVRGRDEEDPSALHQRIERIERHAHRHDAGGHCGAAPYEQREDEGPLQIMALEQEKQHERPGLKGALGEKPQHRHQDENGRLHHHPAHAVGDGEAVTPVEQVAVSGFKEVEDREDRAAQHRHADQEEVEEVGVHAFFCDCHTKIGIIWRPATALRQILRCGIVCGRFPG